MTCTKRRYDKVGAMIALAGTDFASNRNSKRHECRMYFCDSCRAWHLTSRRAS